MKKLMMCLGLLFSICTFAKDGPLPLATDVDVHTPMIDPIVLQEYKTQAKELGFSIEKLEDSKY